MRCKSIPREISLNNTSTSAQPFAEQTSIVMKFRERVTIITPSRFSSATRLNASMRIRTWLLLSLSKWFFFFFIVDAYDFPLRISTGEKPLTVGSDRLLKRHRLCHRHI